MPGRLEARADANAALRVVIQRLVATDAGEGDLAAVTSELRSIADRLEPHQLAHRYEGGDAADTGWLTHPMTGAGNALANPLTVETTPDGRAVVTGTYTHAYEGPAGRLHGGYVAMGMDLVLGRAVGAAGFTAFTGILTVRYRKPTPLFVPVRYEGEVLTTEGRKITARAVLRAEGEVTAEADGIWITAS